MAYIYKITNKINGKLYVGKTNLSLERRFNQHVSDSTKQSEQHRPLYAAFAKYGVENFEISLIEETPIPEEREQFYIDKLNTYVGNKPCNGYNATSGGDGKPYALCDSAEVDLLIELYNKKLPITSIAKALKRDTRTVTRKLVSLGLNVDGTRNVEYRNILKLDLVTGSIIDEYASGRDAGRAIGDVRKSMHILKVCNGLRKQAYGFRWAYK